MVENSHSVGTRSPFLKGSSSRRVAQSGCCWCSILSTMQYTEFQHVTTSWTRESCLWLRAIYSQYWSLLGQPEITSRARARSCFRSGHLMLQVIFEKSAEQVAEEIWKHFKNDCSWKHCVFCKVHTQKTHIEACLQVKMCDPILYYMWFAVAQMTFPHVTAYACG